MRRLWLGEPAFVRRIPVPPARQLMQERIKVKALSEELENPNNKHRWRKLEGSDPATYELVQKIHMLQKRLIEKSEEVVEKDPTVTSHLQLDYDEDGQPTQLRFAYVDEAECIGCTYCASIARNSFFMEPEAGRARDVHSKHAQGRVPRGRRRPRPGPHARRGI